MTQQTVTHQAPLSMRFSRQEFCGGSPCLLWGIFPTQGSNPCLLHLLHWWTDSLPLYHLIIHLLSHLSFTKVPWGKYYWIPLYRRESGDTVLSSSQQRKVRARIWTRQYRMKLFSCSVMSNFLRPHGLQHTRLPCPSPTPGVCSNLCPLSRWCHPTISKFSVHKSIQHTFNGISGSVCCSNSLTHGILCFITDKKQQQKFWKGYTSLWKNQNWR